MSVHSAPGEPNLRYWLANEDWYPSKFTRDFLAQTPEAEANDALAEIARDADLEKLSFWGIFAILFAVAGFTMSFGFSGPSLMDRKAGIRAALLLAERGDVRALAPLARVWSKGGLLASKYQEQIEPRLTSLLADVRQADLAEHAISTVSGLVPRVWNARPAAQDLTSGQTNLLLALFHFLQATHSPPLKALQQIASAPPKGTNRQMIQEAARFLFQEATPSG